VFFVYLYLGVYIYTRKLVLPAIVGEWLRVFACPYRLMFVVVFAADSSVRRSIGPLTRSVCLSRFRLCVFPF